MLSHATRGDKDLTKASERAKKSVGRVDAENRRRRISRSRESEMGNEVWLSVVVREKAIRGYAGVGRRVVVVEVVDVVVVAVQFGGG